MLSALDLIALLLGAILALGVLAIISIKLARFVVLALVGFGVVIGIAAATGIQPHRAWQIMTEPPPDVSRAPIIPKF